jgi:ribonuclease Z
VKPLPLLEVGGVSVAGLETCIDVPELKLCFDVGRCPRWAVDRSTVLFTHTHLDHLGGVAAHAGTRAMLGQKPPKYVIAPEHAAALERLFETWRELDQGELPYELVTADLDSEVRLARDWTATAFRSVHRIACQGYTLRRRRTRLDPRYAGSSERELARLGAAGVQLSTETWVDELAFTGDTRVDVLDREEHLLRTRVLVIECSFLDERVPVEKARSTGHTHLDEIVERADRFENERVVLTHFSSRYSPDEVRRLLDRKLPTTLRERVVPLLRPAPPGNAGP